MHMSKKIRRFYSEMSFMHKQIPKEFEDRKYLYECKPFEYVNLWNHPNQELYDTKN